MCLSPPKPPKPPVPPPPVKFLPPVIGEEDSLAAELERKRRGKSRLQIPLGGSGIGTFDNPTTKPTAGLGIRG